MIGSIYLYFQKDFIFNPLKEKIQSIKNFGIQSLIDSSQNLRNIGDKFLEKYYGCQKWYSFLDPKCWVADIFLTVGENINSIANKIENSKYQIEDNLNFFLLQQILQIENYFAYIIGYLFFLHFSLFILSISLLYLIRMYSGYKEKKKK